MTKEELVEKRFPSQGQIFEKSEGKLKYESEMGVLHRTHTTRATICFQCKGSVGAQKDVLVIEDWGIFHPECVEVPGDS